MMRSTLKVDVVQHLENGERVLRAHIQPAPYGSGWMLSWEERGWTPNEVDELETLAKRAVKALLEQSEESTTKAELRAIPNYNAVSDSDETQRRGPVEQVMVWKGNTRIRITSDSIVIEELTQCTESIQEDAIKQWASRVSGR